MSKVRVKYNINFPDIEFSSCENDLIDTNLLNKALERARERLSHKSAEKESYYNTFVQQESFYQRIEKKISNIKENLGDIVFNMLSLEHEAERARLKIAMIEELEGLDIQTYEQEGMIDDFYNYGNEYTANVIKIAEIARQDHDATINSALSTIMTHLQHKIKRADFTNSPVIADYTTNEYLNTKIKHDDLAKEMPHNIFNMIKSKAQYRISKQIIEVLQTQLLDQTIHPLERPRLSEKLKKYQHMYNESCSSFQKSNTELLDIKDTLFTQLTQYIDMKYTLYESECAYHKSNKEWEKIKNIISKLEESLQNTEELTKTEETSDSDLDRVIISQTPISTTYTSRQIKQTEDYDSDSYSIVTFPAEDQEHYGPFIVNNPIISARASDEEDILSSPEVPKVRFSSKPRWKNMEDKSDENILDELLRELDTLISQYKKTPENNNTYVKAPNQQKRSFESFVDSETSSTNIPIKYQNIAHTKLNTDLNPIFEEVKEEAMLLGSITPVDLNAIFDSL